MRQPISVCDVGPDLDRFIPDGIGGAADALRRLQIMELCRRNRQQQVAYPTDTQWLPCLENDLQNF